MNSIGVLLLMTAAQAIPQPEWLQYGSFGLLALLIGYTVIYMGPRVVHAIESIAPTIVKQMEVQEERHARERAEWNAERQRYLKMLVPSLQEAS